MRKLFSLFEEAAEYAFVAMNADDSIDQVMIIPPWRLGDPLLKIEGTTLIVECAELSNPHGLNIITRADAKAL